MKYELCKNEKLFSIGDSVLFRLGFYFVGVIEKLNNKNAWIKIVGCASQDSKTKKFYSNPANPFHTNYLNMEISKLNKIKEI